MQKNSWEDFVLLQNCRRFHNLYESHDTVKNKVLKHQIEGKLWTKCSCYEEFVSKQVIANCHSFFYHLLPVKLIWDDSLEGHWILKRLHQGNVYCTALTGFGFYSISERNIMLLPANYYNSHRLTLLDSGTFRAVFSLDNCLLCQKPTLWECREWTTKLQPNRAETGL